MGQICKIEGCEKELMSPWELDHGMCEDHEVGEEELKSIIEEKINDIYLHIQTEMGVDTGDYASLYHSGKGDDLEATMLNHFQGYIKGEENERSES